MKRNKYFSYFRNEFNNAAKEEPTIQELTKNGYKQGQEPQKENKSDLNFAAYKKATKQLEKAIGNKQRFNDYNSEHRHKKVVVFSGRVHPGETNSSYCIQGVIDFLVSHSPEAKMLRSYFIFKIIPMLNPDGVAVGNYRCSVIGADLNRRWINPSPICHPAIFTTKYLIQVFNKEHGVVLYTDFHGHSRKKNVFMYGCCGFTGDPNAAKVSSIIKTFPFLVNQINKSVTTKDCKFGLEKEKESTARIVLFKELNIINSYTLEASFYKSDFKSMCKI